MRIPHFFNNIMMSNETTDEGKEILQQRILAALSMPGPNINPTANAHGSLNQRIHTNSKIKQAKASYDAQGITCPTQVISLLIDANRKANHSRTLAKNINANTGVPRPQNVAAHHIVARLAWQANIARQCLFMCGIAMNDADNGVYLPRYAHSLVPSLPTAQIHSYLHTDTYYLEVNFRLDSVKHLGSTSLRQVLRAIKQDLLAGTFPY